MGHLTEISDGMFGRYILVGQPLLSMKIPLLKVPSGGQGHRSRPKVKWVHFRRKKIKKMLLFSDFIKQMWDTKILSAISIKWPLALVPILTLSADTFIAVFGGK